MRLDQAQHKLFRAPWADGVDAKQPRAVQGRRLMDIEVVTQGRAEASNCQASIRRTVLPIAGPFGISAARRIDAHSVGNALDSM